jgi:hypothetical protein
LYSCCSNLDHRASMKRFVSLQFLNLRHSVGLLGRGISPSQGHYLTQTQNKHKSDIHALSGIRTHDPSVRAGEDSSCLRLRGHRDRHRFCENSCIECCVLKQALWCKQVLICI